MSIAEGGGFGGVVEDGGHAERGGGEEGVHAGGYVAVDAVSDDGDFEAGEGCGHDFDFLEAWFRLCDGLRRLLRERCSDVKDIGFLLGLDHDQPIRRLWNADIAYGRSSMEFSLKDLPDDSHPI